PTPFEIGKIPARKILSQRVVNELLEFHHMLQTALRNVELNDSLKRQISEAEIGEDIHATYSDCYSGDHTRDYACTRADGYCTRNRSFAGYGERRRHD